MEKLYRLITFKNRTQVAESCPSMKHPSGKLMLFTSQQKANEYAKEMGWKRWLYGPYADEFTGKLTKRYIIDPLLQKGASIRTIGPCPRWAGIGKKRN